jgi:hypothetical protein
MTDSDSDYDPDSDFSFGGSGQNEQHPLVANQKELASKLLEVKKILYEKVVLIDNSAPAAQSMTLLDNYREHINTIFKLINNYIETKPLADKYLEQFPEGTRESIGSLFELIVNIFTNKNISAADMTAYRYEITRFNQYPFDLNNHIS